MSIVVLLFSAGLVDRTTHEPHEEQRKDDRGKSIS